MGGVPHGNSCDDIEDIEMHDDVMLSSPQVPYLAPGQVAEADPILAELSFIGGGEDNLQDPSGLKLFAQPSIQLANQECQALKGKNLNETLFDDEVTKALLNGINNKSVNLSTLLIDHTNESIQATDGSRSQIFQE